MKFKTARIKIDGIWSTLYLERIASDIWNLGIIVNKSKRAANDWYFGRKNKRSRRVAAQQPVGSIRHLRAAFVVLKKLLKEIPEDHHIYTQPESSRSALLSRYIQRLGFISVQRGDQLFWVLVADRRREVLQNY
jgi:hypothetical protein